MRLGYGLITCQRYPGDPRSAADLYRETLVIARACEAAGLDSVWTSEHHFFDDDYMPSLCVVSAAIAAVTERIMIGTGVILGPLHHPIRLAEDASTVDLLSGGRFVLGLGMGWRQEEFDRFGVPRAMRPRRLTETVEILRRAWGPEAFSFQGQAFRFGPTNVTPKPAHPIPIWVGGFVDEALRRAGRIGDGYLASSSGLEDLPRRKSLVEDALAGSGRDPSGFTFAAHEPVWISEEPDRGLTEVLPHFHYARWKYRDMERAFGRSGSPSHPPPPDQRRGAELAAALIVGSPSRVAERIGAYREVLGDEMHFVARSYWPGIPLDRALSQIEMLGEVRRLLSRGSGG